MSITKGPWKKVGGRSCIADEPATWSVEGPESDFMYLRNEADARAVSAVPEMMEALSHVLFVLNSSSPDFPIGECDLAAMKVSIATALSKAKGEVNGV